MDTTAELISQVDDLFIEVELRERDLDTFKKKVADEGGQWVTKATEGVLFQKNRGTCCRIYFNANESIVDQLAMFGYFPVDKVKDKEKRGEWRGHFRYRLDSNSFFFKLVRNGFRLGAWPCPMTSLSVAAS